MRGRWRRLGVLCLVPGLLVLGAAGWMVLREVEPLLPLPVRRAILELALRSALVGYALLVAVGVFGTVIFGARLLRGGGRRAGVGMAACLGALALLAAAEFGAAAWRAHQRPPTRLPTAFRPPDGDVRLVVAGSSSAMGFPFEPNFSIGHLVAEQLDRALPGRRVHLDNRASLGATGEALLVQLSYLSDRPDIVLIYTGSSEFSARYVPGRRTRFDEEPALPGLAQLYELSLHSPLFRLLYDTVNRGRNNDPGRTGDPPALIDRPWLSRSEHDDAVAIFRDALAQVLDWCDQIETLPVIVLPPTNEGDFEPTRSLVPVGTPEAERRWLRATYEAARAAEDPEPDRALDLYRAILARQPAFAEAHYRAGKLLQRQGQYDEARAHIRQALDCDGQPTRATTELMEIARALAARHPRAIVVDGPAALRAICPSGVVDDDAMIDGQHPSPRGTTALARAVLEALHERKALGWPGPAPEPLQPAEVAARYLSDGLWTRACNWGRDFYSNWAKERFDPAERLAKSQRYQECGERILDGLSPPETGFPPLGLDPLPEGGSPAGGLLRARRRARRIEADGPDVPAPGTIGSRPGAARVPPDRSRRSTMATATWVTSLLEQRGVPFQQMHHDPAFTAQEVAHGEHVSGHRLAKVVVVMADGRPVEAILPASRRIDLNRLRAALDAREVRLASEAEMQRVFRDVETGAIPALRHWDDVEVVMDESMMIGGEIVLQGGTHEDAVCMNFDDWFKLVLPRVGVFTEPSVPRMGRA
jgi:Ala-tRNA(Pro) deacylase